MNEFFARNRLSSYIDGALSHRDNREMELLLRDNVDVRTAHSNMVRAVDLVAIEGRIAPPEELIEEIVSLYPSRPRKRVRFGLIPLFSMVFIASGLAFGVYYYTQGGGEQVVDISAQREQFLAAEEVIEIEEVLAPTAEIIDPDVVSQDSIAVPTPQTVPSPPLEIEPPLDASTYDEVGPQAELDLTSTNEWEELWEGAGDREDGTLTVPSSYRFYAIDSGSLSRIESLASSVGGSLQSQNGSEFQTFRMSTERNFSNFVVRIPSESVESFLGELQLLGSLSVVASEGVLLSPNVEVELGVQVQYSP
jgi:hypothetical protein